MYCQNCGQRIADNSKFCQFCGETIRGTPRQSEELRGTPIRQPRKSKQVHHPKRVEESNATKVIIGITVGAIVIISAMILVLMVKAQVEHGKPISQTVISGNNKTDDNRLFDEVEAFTVAEYIVRENLKAPSTAKFCKVTEAKCSYDSVTKYWTVTGWVDAQNSFGAMIRQNFTAKFQQVREGEDIGCKHGTCTFD